MAQERLGKKFDKIEALETIFNIVINRRQSFQDQGCSGLGMFPKSISFPPSHCHCLILLPYHFHDIAYSAAISQMLSNCPNLVSFHSSPVSKDQTP